MRYIPLFCLAVSGLVHMGAWLAMKPSEAEAAMPHPDARLAEVSFTTVAPAPRLELATNPLSQSSSQGDPLDTQSDKTADSSEVVAWRASQQFKGADPTLTNAVAPLAPVSQASSSASQDPTNSKAKETITQPADTPPVEKATSVDTALHSTVSPALAESTPKPLQAATDESAHDAPPLPAGSQWQKVGPPPGLRLPSSLRAGKRSADLVIDPRDKNFIANAQALGMKFILFQNGSFDFYMELDGPQLESAVRRTGLDASKYSRRARDLAGAATFDRLRDAIAAKYGLDPKQCRVAALVPVAVDAAFRAAEQHGIESLGMPREDVAALCGTITCDPTAPLHITLAWTVTGEWFALQP